jgi:sialate O-acetylesterase
MATIKLLEASGGDEAALADQYRAKLDAWFVLHDPGATDATAPWFDPAMDDSDWEQMDLPVMWEEAGHDGFDGIGWFRRSFDLPTDWSHREITLHVSAVDDVDTTWVNGHLLGTTPGWNTPRTYTVPAEYLRPTDNVIAVRVLDTGGGGGIWLPDAPLELRLADEPEQKLPLTGAWSYHLVADLQETPRPPNDPSNNSGTPTVLYTGMIAPLVPYAMRGAIFYQGEANAYRADEYRTLLPDLIGNWREQWSAPEMPFLFVQIAPFKDMPPEIREAQLLAWRSTAHTAMTVTIDAGDAEDIHPAMKEPVGERLALAARALAYGEQLEYSGPVYREAEFRDGAAVLHFDHVAEGLVAPGGALHGFTMAGENGEFYEAKATIKNDTVVVRSEQVERPVVVRYGWTNVASGNLFNTAGLPASPFRTDHP